MSGMVAVLAMALAQAADARRSANVPAQAALGEFGRCIARMAPDRSRALMRSTPDSVQEAALARTLAHAHAGCSGRYAYLAMRTGEIRGAIAEALVLADPGMLSRVAAVRPAPATRVTATGGRPFVIAYADCLTRGAPATAMALLRTEHASRAETEAAMAFGPLLNGCMPETGKYRFDVRDVRNHVADATYRLGHADPVGSEP